MILKHRLEWGQQRMRLISIKVLKAGMVMGRTIWNDGGHPLIQKNVVVTNDIIKRLKELNIQYVYIKDELSEDIEILDVLTPNKRKEVVTHIKESFKQMKELNPQKASYVLDIKSKLITNIVDELLMSVLNSKEMLTVLTDAFVYDEYLYQHSLQVTIYSIAIAKQLGYSAEEMKVIGIGALLHDVGKLVVPQEIIKKPGKLTNEEFKLVKQHTKYGFDILRNLHSISLLVAHCAFQHHERLDGSGYPRGLVKDKIHPYAKIIAVADVFDAMSNDRVYRKKMLPHECIEIISKGRGTLFDENVVDALKQSVVHYPNGTVVLLSDGRRGIVIKQNDENSALPYIRIFEENNQIIKPTYHINLMELPNVSIVKVETDYIQYV